MSKRFFPLVLLSGITMILILVASYSIAGIVKPKKSQAPPAALALSQLSPPPNGRLVHYYHKISQEVNGKLSELKSIVTLQVIESNAKSYEVELDIKVLTATGVFDGIMPSLSDKVIVDSALHTVTPDFLDSYSLAIFFPSSLDFAGTPIFSNGPEIHSGDTWLKDGVTFSVTTVAFNGGDALEVSASSEISTGTFILSPSEWPYINKMSITTKEEFQPFTYNYIPQGQANGTVPPPLEIEFPELMITRIVEAEILD